MAKSPKLGKDAVAPRGSVEEIVDDTALVGDVRTVHPDLMAVRADYAEMRDCRAGPTRIKEVGEVYLPMPSGFGFQTDSGVGMYKAYKTRAQFPDIVSPTILGMVGIIHHREAKIEGLEEGSALFPLNESASPDLLPLEALHRRITEEILTLGRVGLFTDMPEAGPGQTATEVPWIALYKGESITNWSEDRDFFVLEEKYRVRTGYSWDPRTRYRVLTLEAGTYKVRLIDEDGTSLLPGQTEDAEGPQDRNSGEGRDVSIEPNIRGGKKLDAIPFVVAGSRDLSLEPDEMPLMGLARAALAIYRLDADYRHQLFWSGQETLVISGLDVKDTPKVVGAGVVLVLPEGGTAEYVGPSGTGIEKHKEAIDDERQVAAAAGAQVFDSAKKSAESGDALRIRARAATATLVTVALTSAAALEQALRNAARFVGEDPDKIVVTPNLDFVDNPLTADEAAKLMELWLQKVISYETLYENLQKGEIASQERTAEEEQEAIAKEESQTTPDGLANDPNATPGGPQPDLSQGTGTDETGVVPPDQLTSLFDPSVLAGA